MKKGLLSQEDYGCKMRGLCLLWIDSPAFPLSFTIWIIMPLHEYKKRAIPFVDGSYLLIHGWMPALIFFTFSDAFAMAT